MKRPLLLILIVLILLSPSSLASIYDVNHLPLLAVQELPDGNYSGNTADLFLEVRDGSGRVFLDTSPLTKIDMCSKEVWSLDLIISFKISNQ